MKPRPCPFCGTDAVGRSDGDELRPFVVRCSRELCPGAHAQGHVDPEMALKAWNTRIQPPPEKPEAVFDLLGFTRKSLIRGELVAMTLDRTGVLTSDALAFEVHSKPLMLKPRDW